MRRAAAFRVAVIAIVVSCCSAAQQLEIKPKPAPAPTAWKAVIGEYAQDGREVNILERDGRLFFLERGSLFELRQPQSGSYRIEGLKSCRNLAPQFSSSASYGSRHAEAVNLCGVVFAYRNFGDTQHSFHITPLHPVAELRRQALAAQPPVEARPLRKPDLVELMSLDSTIHLDIRYATANNFMGAPFYHQARAFLQRPAAEALVRANRQLHAYGYGLLIHDAYRPWFVTKMFWDGTPADKKNFVADPAKGSNHNRGGAVDLSLYDLRTGAEVEMPGGYDEMSDRSYANYEGGTSLQRWRRDLLRAAMEAQGFKVYTAEWWHFDYKDWSSYPVLNVPFSKLSQGRRVN